MSLVDLYNMKTGKEFAKQTIEAYIKKNKLTIEEFFKQNPTVKDFDINTNLGGIIRTHGYFAMQDSDYIEIINQIIEQEKAKNKLQLDNLTTNFVNGHELVTYTDEQTNKKTVLDNTVSNRSVENQMKDVQKEHRQFQNSDDDNTANVVEFMKKNIKITPKTQNSNEIKKETLDSTENRMMAAIKSFETSIGHSVDVDLDSKLIYDNGSIYSIEERDGEFKIIAQKATENESENENAKGQQLVKKIQMPKAS